MLIYHHLCFPIFLSFFFFNDTATTEIYTLSLHDALPISEDRAVRRPQGGCRRPAPGADIRSEEHTSELQSQSNLVCRLLLEKKKKIYILRNHQHLPLVRHSTAPSHYFHIYSRHVPDTSYY